MGKVLSTGARYAAQRFNVENRAQKVISKDKPIKAPWHESNQRDLEKILKGKNL
jgi:NADH dehydrogenase [ubiquinone] 1 alpha subcomplex assembly factor 4